MQTERSPTDERDQEVIEAAESSEGEETILKMFCKSKINIWHRPPLPGEGNIAQD